MGVTEKKFRLARRRAAWRRRPGGGFQHRPGAPGRDWRRDARALYAELHRCDAAGAELIVVEAPPDLPEWSGIADRLRRAAA